MVVPIPIMLFELFISGIQAFAALVAAYIGVTDVSSIQRKLCGSL